MNLHKSRQRNKMRIKPTMSMHLSISDLNADLVSWYQERTKKLEDQLQFLVDDDLINDHSVEREVKQLLSK